MTWQDSQVKQLLPLVYMEQATPISLLQTSFVSLYMSWTRFDLLYWSLSCPSLSISSRVMIIKSVVSTQGFYLKCSVKKVFLIELNQTYVPQKTQRFKFGFSIFWVFGFGYFAKFAKYPFARDLQCKSLAKDPLTLKLKINLLSE